MDNEIEVYYHWDELDKKHVYCVVTKFSSEYYGNYWVNWLWYRMGAAFPDKLPFILYPYKMEWQNQKLIKKYKTVNNAHFVPASILSHFKKIS